MLQNDHLSHFRHLNNFRRPHRPGNLAGFSDSGGGSSWAPVLAMPISALGLGFDFFLAGPVE
ncbi:hypothetical protein ABT120_12840 [Nonomuraea angiospora]|uniref:hypothetical protein n=1 Tax=Nonomuraea angiospora TaxID=46172 RepID=UPI00331B4BEA